MELVPHCRIREIFHVTQLNPLLLHNYFIHISSEAIQHSNLETPEQDWELLPVEFIQPCVTRAARVLGNAIVVREKFYFVINA